MPLSAPLLSLSRLSVDQESKYIKVRPTLQIADPQYPKVFALGDVADTGAGKAARPATVQAQIVAENIMSLIKAEDADLKEYKADPPAIHLSLGLVSLRTFSRMITDGVPRVQSRDVKFRNPPAGSKAQPGVQMGEIDPEDVRKREVGCERIWNTRAPGVTDYHL